MLPDLPAALRQAAEGLLDGVARAQVSDRSAEISTGYRAGQTSRHLIGDADAARAYVLSRLPATYAANSHVLGEVLSRLPDFTPGGLLDAGAGPGGASWAALQAWPDLSTVTQLDANRPFLDMARRLGEAGSPALSQARQIQADLCQPPTGWPASDLVMVSYALAELEAEDQVKAITSLWSVCQGLLVIVEPGTPAGHQRILAARTQLIGQGAGVVAPCPHAEACGVVAPDWCHFVQRLPRARSHRDAKRAERAYEDEKFSYLVVARPQLLSEQAYRRIIGPPVTTKSETRLKLCTPQGVITETVRRRDKAAYARVRRLNWGDVLPETLD